MLGNFDWVNNRKSSVTVPQQLGRSHNNNSNIKYNKKTEKIGYFALPFVALYGMLTVTS